MEIKITTHRKYRTRCHFIHVFFCFLLYVRLCFVLFFSSFSFICFAKVTVFDWEIQTKKYQNTKKSTHFTLQYKCACIDTFPVEHIHKAAFLHHMHAYTQMLAPFIYTTQKCETFIKTKSNFIQRAYVISVVILW